MSKGKSYTEYGDLSINEAKDILREWRERNERRSEDVIEIWAAIRDFDNYPTLDHLLGKLGNEKHVLLEQVIFAALDTHQLVYAHEAIGALSEEFPASLRVLRYKAMQLEATGHYDEALEIIDRIIKVDETNAAARKRRVAILKAQGQTAEAIKELVDYLKKFMSDVEAWQELSELYLQTGELSRAAFCAEEILLHQPHNHLMHQRLADIRYTMGGTENMEFAKTYYCHALKLNPNNMRALLGLFLVTNNLLNQYKSSGNTNKRKEVWKLSQWAQTRASRLQAKDSGLSQMMLTLAISD